MRPQPQCGVRDYLGSEKLRRKVALIPRGERVSGARSPSYLQKKGGDEAVSNFKEDKAACGTKTARGGSRPEMSPRGFGALSSAKALDKLLHRGRAPGVFLSQCGNYLFCLFVFAFHSRHMLDLFLKRRLHFLGRR